MNFSEKTAATPTREEFRLSHELRKAQEEIRRLRNHAESLGKKYRVLAEAANELAAVVGEPALVEDHEESTPIPERLVEPLEGVY